MLTKGYLEYVFCRCWPISHRTFSTRLWQMRSEQSTGLKGAPSYAKVTFGLYGHEVKRTTCLITCSTYYSTYSFVLMLFSAGFCVCVFIYIYIYISSVYMLCSTNIACMSGEKPKPWRLQGERRSDKKSNGRQPRPPDVARCFCCCAMFWFVLYVDFCCV